MIGKYIKGRPILRLVIMRRGEVQGEQRQVDGWSSIVVVGRSHTL